MLKSVPGLLTIALSIGAFATPTFAADIFQGNGSSVFVMTNDNIKNEVLTYERSYNGQYVLRTRTATDGRGSGGKTDPLQSQGALTLSADHNLLFRGKLCQWHRLKLSSPGRHSCSCRQRIFRGRFSHRCD